MLEQKYIIIIYSTEQELKTPEEEVATGTETLTNGTPEGLDLDVDAVDGTGIDLCNIIEGALSLRKKYYFCF